ncbi:response regulator transcription factor [Streptomyces ficellus]|uniref:DNA-binding response regulator n=1 Tax=Streptomyces ficellus TaxID=1977088 RepID=A0A6I6FGW3_9ACTN|nr:response regulator transcription factor [Streptomyces ficellus]QGV82930.1 DNA-binding response regulator [Streptomyces ficellus]
MIVAEDAPLLRQGLVRLLEDCGVDVVGQTGESGEVLDLVESTRPDAVLLDIRMPPTHTDEGVRAAEAILARRPGTGVLLLSQYVETSAAVHVLARSPGGFGYLLKERVADAHELHDALRRVAAGESAIDPEIVSRLLARRRTDSLLDGLTGREREVLALMAQGRSNEAIRERLHVGAKTLETHIRSVFTKLGLESEVTDNRRVLAVLTYLRG